LRETCHKHRNNSAAKALPYLVHSAAQWRNVGRKAVRPDRARELVSYMQASKGASKRRTCNVFPTNRATVRYKAGRPDKAGLEMRIKDLAATRLLT
jgi:hypothetical protein